MNIFSNSRLIFFFQTSEYNVLTKIKPAFQLNVALVSKHSKLSLVFKSIWSYSNVVTFDDEVARVLQGN